MNKLLLCIPFFLIGFLPVSGQERSLRGRALFLELERARSLPADERPGALVQVARDAAEPSNELLAALSDARRAERKPGTIALLLAAGVRVQSLGANRISTEALAVADRSIARTSGDTVVEARMLLADAADFSGQTGKSIAYRLKIEAALALQAGGSPERIRNLDALTRISNEPSSAASYAAMLHTGGISEQDRVHILSRLLINLYRLDARTAMGEPWKQLQAALRKPPPDYDKAEVTLASALYAEASGRPLEARSWFRQVPVLQPSPSATEALIGLADYHSRNLRFDSANYYFNKAKGGIGFREVPGLRALWMRSYGAYLSRKANPEPSALLRGRLQQQDSLYQAELQSSTRELVLQYQLLENEARNRTLRDQQQLAELELKQQRQRSLITVLVLSLLTLVAAGAAALFYQRRLHASKLHVTELQRLNLEHRSRLMTELNAAQESERSRIAGELHDDVGTLLSVARMNLSAGNDPGQLATAGKLLGEVAQTIRTMSHQLMPVALEQYGFRHAVEQLVADINAAQQVPVELVIVGFDKTKYTPVVYSTCYRMLQELLQNVLKHAAAGHALVQLVEHPEALSLMVEDDGRGMADGESRDGRGLKLLASRVAFLGGTLHVDSNAGQGTVALIDIPVTPVLLINEEHGATGSDIHRR